ncbi:MAG TPA: F0F1 ATP synthase subunit A [Myxococcota bacterium]|jgi:F-type H+-transporting ATPase subunit a
MDHHTSWLSFLPGYQSLLHYVQDRYGNTELMSDHISTVHHVFAAALVVILLMIGSFFARMRIKDLEQAIVPPKTVGIVAFFEVFLEILFDLMESTIGPTYKRYVPVIGTLALFIFCNNLISLIPGMKGGTDSVSTTVALASVSWVYFNYHAFRVQGFHHIVHLANPVGVWWGWILAPLMFPIEVVSLFVRVVSLSIRLAANMVADHALLLAFAGIFPLLLPLPFYALGLLVCLVQTAVFVILSCVYIALHTAEAEGEGHAH